jgi:putative acyl-CoA dehydrogenase
MDDSFATHDVFNQSPALEDVNLFNSDRALMEAVQREGAGHAAKRLAAFGQICGSADALQQGRLANEHPPRLKAFDAKGRRLDVVEFHPCLSRVHGDQRQGRPALLGLGSSGEPRRQAGAGRQRGALRPAATSPCRWRPDTSVPSP